MYLMDLIVSVAKIKSRDLIVLMINTLVIILFYYLLFDDSEIIYPLMLSIFIISIYFVIEVIKYKNFKEKLLDSKRSPDYSNSDLTYMEEEVLSVVRALHKEYISDITVLKRQISDRDTLFSQWIHNMKTSITVIDLACEKNILNGEENKCITDIQEENRILKKNLEECLNVLRLDDFSRDYMTKNINLKELINYVVNFKKRDFIYKGVFPKVSIDKNISVYTDKKWATYMIEQIINNSIKYSKEKNGDIVEISAKESEEYVELKIKDYGIGIKEEDLPRLFESFYTGNNGRDERSSTGIGLYMVKLISERLGHAINLESVYGEGTVFTIKFNINKIFNNK